MPRFTWNGSVFVLTGVKCVWVNSFKTSCDDHRRWTSLQWQTFSWCTVSPPVMTASWLLLVLSYLQAYDCKFHTEEVLMLKAFANSASTITVQ